MKTKKTVDCMTPDHQKAASMNLMKKMMTMMMTMTMMMMMMMTIRMVEALTTDGKKARLEKDLGWYFL